MNKKLISLISVFMVMMTCFAAGVKRVSATKDRNCRQVLVVNESSQSVRVAQADGVNVTGTIGSGQRSSFSVNTIVLEIGNNCNASSSVSGGNYVITITGGSNNSVKSTSTNSSNSQNNRCTVCHGSGKCQRCNGDGKYYNDGHYGPKARQLDRYVKCNRCNGSGKCSYCHGTGKR